MLYSTYSVSLTSTRTRYIFDVNNFDITVFVFRSYRDFGIIDAIVVHLILGVISALHNDKETKMIFLAELDHPQDSQMFTEDTARTFIEDSIFPTIAKAEHLIQQGRIVAGGPVTGRIAIRFTADVETTQQLDQVISSLPLWMFADTRVTPLIDFSDRRAHIQALLQWGRCRASASCMYQSVFHRIYRWLRMRVCSTAQDSIKKISISDFRRIFG
jgi:muconolactone delta-isomerase